MIPMLRIAVVEDEKACQEQLTEFFERYQKERGVRLEVQYFDDGAEAVEGYQSVYDLLLMDIQLPLLDGMTAAELIRDRDAEVQILFITNMKQFAIQGYRVGALDYLLKPVSYFALSQRLDKVMERQQRRRRHYVTIVSEGNWHKLDISQVFYIESQDHTLLYHTSAGSYPVIGTMKSLVRELEPMGCFFRCGKSFLVNLEHVDAVRDHCAVVSGTMIPISRGKKGPLLSALTKYLNGGLA